MRARPGCRRILSEHHEHHAEDQGKRRWSPVCNRTVGKEDADYRRAEEEDSAKRQDDPKSPGDEPELTPDSTWTERQNGHRYSCEQD
jgi:hypothetical protein